MRSAPPRRSRRAVRRGLRADPQQYHRLFDEDAVTMLLCAYEAGLRPNDTRMLLTPDSEFFRYFVDPSGKPPAPRPPRNSGRSPSGQRLGRDGEGR